MKIIHRDKRDEIHGHDNGLDRSASGGSGERIDTDLSVHYHSAHEKHYSKRQ